ncbi:MAG: hypothetical protein AAF577_02605 [Pseudomonadota bacterium]
MSENPFLAIMALQTQATLSAVAMMSAGVQAISAAAASGPISLNTQINAPFSRDFNQDIDPVTTWMFPFALGFLPGSQRAASLLTEMRCLHGICAALIEACDAEPRALTSGDDAARVPPMSSGDIAAMRRSVETMNTLIGRPRR